MIGPRGAGGDGDGEGTKNEKPTPQPRTSPHPIPARFVGVPPGFALPEVEKYSIF